MLPVIEAFMAAHQLPDVTIVADAGMASEANQKDIEKAGLSFILGMKIPRVPYEVAQWRREHPGEEIPDGHVLTQPGRIRRLGLAEDVQHLCHVGIGRRNGEAAWARTRSLRDDVAMSVPNDRFRRHAGSNHKRRGGADHGDSCVVLMDVRKLNRPEAPVLKPSDAVDVGDELTGNFRHPSFGNEVGG